MRRNHIMHSFQTARQTSWTLFRSARPPYCAYATKPAFECFAVTADRSKEHVQRRWRLLRKLLRKLALYVWSVVNRLCRNVQYLVKTQSKYLGRETWLQYFFSAVLCSVYFHRCRLKISSVLQNLVLLLWKADQSI